MEKAEIAAWQKRLEETFAGPIGILGERILKLRGVEQGLGEYLVSRFVGYVILMDSFLDFYIESIETVAARRKADWSPILPVITATHIPTLWRFRASYLVFWNGYFVDAISLLRGIFENALQIAALQHGIVTVSDIFGKLTQDEAAGLSADEIARRLRTNIIEADKTIRVRLLGKESRLSLECQDDMLVLQEILHGAVHKSKLDVFRLYGPWVRGEKAMLIYPTYDEKVASLYLNISQAIGWMVVRTLPLLQTEAGEFPKTWQEKWAVLEDSFKIAVGAHPKRMFRSVEELIASKFAFT